MSPQTAWIRCVERLPREGDGQVLAINSAGYMATVTHIYERGGVYRGEDATPEETRDVISDVAYWCAIEPPAPGHVNVRDDVTLKQRAIALAHSLLPSPRVADTDRCYDALARTRAEYAPYAGALKAALEQEGIAVEVISTVGIVGCKLCKAEEGPHGLIHAPTCVLSEQHQMSAQMPKRDYMDTPHYRINKFVSTVSVMGKDTKLPSDGTLVQLYGIKLAFADLEALVRDTAHVYASNETPASVQMQACNVQCEPDGCATCPLIPEPSERELWLKSALTNENLVREIAMQLRPYTPICEEKCKEMLDDIRQGIAIYINENISENAVSVKKEG